MISPTQTRIEGTDIVANPALDISDDASLDMSTILQESQVMEVLQKLDQELVGLRPVKTRIREIAALLLIDRMRHSFGLMTRPPTSGRQVRVRRRLLCAWQQSCTGSTMCVKDIL